MNDEPSFPVHDPDPKWFPLMWAAAAALTVLVSAVIDSGLGL